MGPPALCFVEFRQLHSMERLVSTAAQNAFTSPFELVLEPRRSLPFGHHRNKHSRHVPRPSVSIFSPPRTWRVLPSLLFPSNTQPARGDQHSVTSLPRSTFAMAQIDRRETLKVSPQGHLTEILLNKGDAIGQAVSSEFFFFLLSSSLVLPFASRN